MNDALKRFGVVLFGNFGLKLFSVLLAFGLWYAVNVAGRDTELTFSVPVTFRSLRKDLVITNTPVHMVTVWIAGTHTVVGAIGRSDLTLDYNLSGLGPGLAEFTVDRHDLRLPDKARLVRVWPASFALRIEPRSALTAPGSATEKADNGS